MKITSACLAISALLASPMAAGVVFEVETKDHDASPPRVDETTMSAEGKNLAMDIAPSREGKLGGKVIFRGDRREMVVVDHDDKSYMVMDQASMEEMAKMVGNIDAQMEEALRNVPEEQRAAVEKMMKQRMPQQPPAQPQTKVDKTGETGTHAGYPCVKYEILRDGRIVRELWVTDWDNIEGGSEASGAFLAMADFMSEMLESISSATGGFGGGLNDSFVAEMKEIDGFPVVTRGLGGKGELENESTLRSSSRRTLDPAEFEPPAGYKRRSMLGES